MRPFCRAASGYTTGMLVGADLSARHSRIIQNAAWDKAGFKSLAINNYLRMNGLFTEIRKTDSDFQNEGDKVPYIWCEAFGQAHMMAGALESACSEETKALLLHSGL